MPGCIHSDMYKMRQQRHLDVFTATTLQVDRHTDIGRWAYDGMHLSAIAAVDSMHLSAIAAVDSMHL